ncbi:MAG: hypothetical protein WEB93_02735, partial [Sphingomonadales bacterium]
MTRHLANYRLAAVALMALTVLFALATPADAGRYVRSTVTVDGPVVTLGDLFDTTGEADAEWTTARVADAPDPGDQRRIRSLDVSAAARRAGLTWDAAAAPSTITIHRSGEAVPPDALSDLLSTRLPDAGNSHWDIQINNSRQGLYLPVGHSVAEITIRHMNFDERSGGFSAALAIPDGGGQNREQTITGRVIEMADV